VAVRIASPALERIGAHAAVGYPLEVCGVLLGSEPGGVTRAIRVPNRDRERPGQRFEIAPRDLVRVQRRARRLGLEILGYYHSHPDHPGAPSETDRRRAAEGLSDGVAHLVIAVASPGRPEVPRTIWVFREAGADFEAEKLERV
jgi:proteasome lid subunit RPN8/RPN11